jgi:DNA polymerase-1
VSIITCRQHGYPTSGSLGTMRFAWMLVPVHDAFVFEAPLEHLATVATLTESVMVQTVQEWFPELRRRAEINITHPECWNHEGNFDSVERFIEDPTWSL